MKYAQTPESSTAAKIKSSAKAELMIFSGSNFSIVTETQLQTNMITKNLVMIPL